MSAKNASSESSKSLWIVPELFHSKHISPPAAKSAKRYITKHKPLSLQALGRQPVLVVTPQTLSTQMHLHSVLMLYDRSSPAVAERPCDASYLSEVSFNSTIPGVQSFSISYFGFRFTNVYN